jgi:hypothetical protein
MTPEFLLVLFLKLFFSYSIQIDDAFRRNLQQVNFKFTVVA